MSTDKEYIILRPQCPFLVPCWYENVPSFHWISSTNITSLSLKLIRAQVIVPLTDSKKYLYIAVDNYSDGKNKTNGNSKDEIQAKMVKFLIEFLLLSRWHVLLKLPSTHATDNFAEEKRFGSETGCDNPSDCNCFPGELLCPSSYRFQWIDDGEVAIDWHYHQKSNRSVQVQETRILDELLSQRFFLSRKIIYKCQLRPELLIQSTRRHIH